MPAMIRPIGIYNPYLRQRGLAVFIGKICLQHIHIRFIHRKAVLLDELSAAAAAYIHGLNILDLLRRKDERFGKPELRLA